jgi:hypothetical protein
MLCGSWRFTFPDMTTLLILNSCFKTATEPNLPWHRPGDFNIRTTLPRLLLSTGQFVSDTVIMMVKCVTVAAAAAAATQQLGSLTREADGNLKYTGTMRQRSGRLRISVIST